MGSKQRSVYRCSQCGGEHPKWAGKCDSCGEWNTLVEELVQRKNRSKVPGTGAVPISNAVEAVKLGDLAAGRLPRITSGLNELDFVLGGGIVPGSLILVGGEPGIGKSTLLLQCAARIHAAGFPTLYAAGEESVEQVALRADRLSEDADGVIVLPEVRVEAVIAKASQLETKLLIVDSIQTTYTDELEGAPGNVGQVRECAARLMRYAKASNAAVVLIGHVTRGGGIAGPKTLEHMVDTVLYFEGETGNEFRVLRAVKNRFGSVDEVGIFEMTAKGLTPVPNPSGAFLTGRDASAAGSAVSALMEGTRPVLVEIQALAAKAGFGTPQRVATGLDHKRLAVLLAILERRAGLPFNDLDVFLNVTGGFRLHETASDLAVAAALWSSVKDLAVPSDMVFLGEVGLGGEVRPVPGTDRRLAEAERLGFTRAVVSSKGKVMGPMETTRISHITDLNGAL
ncbi:MAG: DNA repair protein RadA [Gemmatimonadota bacterium]|nr:DNA repair protein RadA [Gemmatimonadota bacterium]